MDVKLRLFPSFQSRSEEDELMDDFSITDQRLTGALEQLRVVNQVLGGYSAPMKALRPLLLERHNEPIRILDLGTGIADFPEYLVRWAASQSPPCAIKVVAVDANPATVAHARRSLAQRLPEELQGAIDVQVADALALPYGDGSFDVVIASMFLHHFAHQKAVTVVQAMQRISRRGIIINDLQRHPLAYYGIAGLTRLLRASEMMQNDGPLSVLRGFQAQELRSIAADAGLREVSIQWCWAFRWLLTNLAVEHPAMNALA
ncbi:methyltransferase domain-containing protein [Synechococcus sp. Tobar12-5m-g]|uniref:methyltransferase domain-containing protein n=1 Tax=unclassified Synechococcus TaxID=2626047 RepID=UPI0020CC7D98|nr:MULTISPECIES: methyltransferase domain-containing protein [unclassified Synechococcus]MCP9771166.1 methyltransferase domain-containing protein [Synechococcus sp. Tobar12-5m-g]MCP9872106.1 methyltransferase domain-containing protein [Synechococcus sp. Cruz CV-v-12]